MGEPLMRSTSHSTLAMRALLLTAMLAAGGCITQKPSPNPFQRSDLPPEARSGFVMQTHGYQADGLKAAWREGDRTFVLTDRTRIGPRDGTPFGNRPNDPIITVVEADPGDYHDAWHQANNHNLWLLPVWDYGILQTEAVYASYRFYHVMLFWNEAGEGRLHKGELSQGQNSNILRDHFVRGWDQGLEYLERFVSGRENRPVYLLREPDGTRHAIAIEPASEPVLVKELRVPQPERRAAAAVLLGHLSGAGKPGGLEALFAALELGEPDGRAREFVFWAVTQYFGVGNYDTVIAERVATMVDRRTAEDLRQYIIRANPGSVLLLGGLGDAAAR